MVEIKVVYISRREEEEELEEEEEEEKVKRFQSTERRRELVAEVLRAIGANRGATSSSSTATSGFWRADGLHVQPQRCTPEVSEQLPELLQGCPVGPAEASFVDDRKASDFGSRLRKPCPRCPGPRAAPQRHLGHLAHASASPAVAPAFRASLCNRADTGLLRLDRGLERV